MLSQLDTSSSSISCVYGNNLLQDVSYLNLLHFCERASRLRDSQCDRCISFDACHSACGDSS